MLLDLNLPDIDGEAVVARLKAEAGHTTRARCRRQRRCHDSSDRTPLRERRDGLSDEATRHRNFLGIIDEHVGVDRTEVATTRPAGLPRAEPKARAPNADILRDLDEQIAPKLEDAKGTGTPEAV